MSSAKLSESKPPPANKLTVTVPAVACPWLSLDTVSEASSADLREKMDLGRQDPGLQDPGLQEEMDLGRQDPGL